jgi:hypothetical protein
MDRTDFGGAPAGSFTGNAEWQCKHDTPPITSGPLNAASSHAMVRLLVMPRTFLTDRLPLWVVIYTCSPSSRATVTSISASATGMVRFKVHVRPISALLWFCFPPKIDFSEQGERRGACGHSTCATRGGRCVPTVGGGGFAWGSTADWARIAIRSLVPATRRRRGRQRATRCTDSDQEERNLTMYA